MKAPITSRRRFLASLAGSLGACGTAASGQRASPVHVSACYYPWYNGEGRHWDQGYFGIEQGGGPELGLYSSRASSVIRQHLAWSGEFGVDNWICSWWGPDSWEDETLRRHVLPEFDDRGGASSTFCILFESEGILGLDPERGIEFGERQAAEFAEHFRYLARTYFDHPAYYRIQGRPVVYLYLSRTFSGDYLRALARARAVTDTLGVPVYLIGDEVFWGAPDPTRIAALDAITSYNMHGPSRFSGQSDWTGFVEESGEVFGRYREVAGSKGVAFIPGVLPGFDAGGLGPENPHYRIPRVLRPGADSVSFLKAQIAMATAHLDPELRTVAVTSFNEWHEGTQIEPGRATGKAAGATLRRMFKAEA